MQGLGGLAPGLKRGATMSGNKPPTDVTTPLAYQLHGVTSGALPLTGTFVADRAGRYKVVAWGPGGARPDTGGTSNANGGGGGLAIKTVRLNKGQSLAIEIQIPSFGVGSENNNTAVTFPDGTVMRAYTGKFSGAAGAATGGDINVSGSPGVIGSPGAAGAAASYGEFIGGAGLQSPGGGGGFAISFTPGVGEVLVLYLGE